MTEIRVTYCDLPDYNFPFTNVSPDTAIGYSLSQARNDDGVWQPSWCLCDPAGWPLAILEADSFDELSPQVIAQKAAEVFLGLHGLGEEDTGHKPVAQAKLTNGADSYTFDVL